ncbi:TPA: hypothetical protein ACOEBL_001696 [Enterobacter cloacae]|uniref:hypothetical protein n=1 Tax=Enterobacter cloacae TaxID=550 RepID=UPI00254B8F30|nr:hypothetical protein [Enterobacter cloacae]ELV2784741.1 hypothetical protein [Enterobacter cloacae]
MKINLSEDDLNAIDIYEQWNGIRNSEANSIYEELYPSIFMTHVHERNYQLLTTTLSQFESVDVIQKYLTGEKINKDQFILITGFFINYIASAIALRDSTRNMQKNDKLFPTALKKQAESKLQNEITSASSIKLVEDIRNIITHQSLIVPALSFIANDEGFFSGYAYKTKDLLNNKRLTEKSREYLLKINHGYLFLRPLIDIYHHTTASYQHWLINVALKKHKNDHPIYWQARENVSFEWGGDLEPSLPLPPSVNRPVLVPGIF